MQRSAPSEPLLPAAAAAVPADTFWPCVANLSKVIIGAGMMAIPQAYCRIGSVAGTSMLVLVGCLTYTTLVFLLRGSAATGATTYSQLTHLLCGPTVTKILQVAVLSFCFGFGVVYLVILRDILLGTPPDCNGLLCELFGLPVSSVLYDARLVIILLALLVCSPLLLFRSMDRLAVLNVVGVAAIGVLALTALGLGAYGVAHGSAHPIPPWPQWQQLGRTAAQQWQAMAQVMPVIIACYVAHQSLYPLMPLLQPYSDTRMRSVIAIALLIAFGVFTSLAVGSSLAFGPALEVNVLNNYSVAGLQPLTGLVLARLLSWCIRGGYFLSLLASLLLYMHPLRACLAEVIWHRHSNSTQGPNLEGLLSGRGPQAHQMHPGETTGLLTLSNPASTLHRKHESINGFGQQGAAAVAAGDASFGRPQTGTSCFAAPAVQAAAVGDVGVPGMAGSSSGGSSSALDSQSSSSSKPLSAFDSLDNPRTGSWSGVHYMADFGAVQPQEQISPPKQGGGVTRGGRRKQAQQYSVQQASQGPHLPPKLPAGQQQQQQRLAVTVHMREGVQIHVSEDYSGPRSRSAAAARQTGWCNAQPSSAGVGSIPAAATSAAAAEGSWREAEQQWYYQLTYGLFGAMVLVAIAVPNIWTALSAIGDLSSTLQAFVVPGLIGLTLTRLAHKHYDSSSSSARQWLQGAGNASVGALAVFLGAVLFVNGIYQRL